MANIKEIIFQKFLSKDQELQQNQKQSEPKANKDTLFSFLKHLSTCKSATKDKAKTKKEPKNIIVEILKTEPIKTKIKYNEQRLKLF